MERTIRSRGTHFSANLRANTLYSKGLRTMPICVAETSTSASGIASLANPPIHEAILLCVNSGLEHRLWKFTLKGLEELASASRCVASRQNIVTVSLKNLFLTIRRRAAPGCLQPDLGLGKSTRSALASARQLTVPANPLTVSYQVNLAAGAGIALLYRFTQISLDQQIRAISVHCDPGIKGLVVATSQPHLQVQHRLKSVPMNPGTSTTGSP